MKTTITKWATKAAGAGAIALLLATPAAAQSRGDWNHNQDQRRESRDNNNYRNDNNNYRENQRINGSGRISSFSHERDGYRVRLENDNRSYWVPESSFRGHQLRAGISIGLGGVFRGGSIYVDAVSWPNDGYGYRDGYNNGYDNGWLRGVVERVDRRDGTLRIRDDRSGRIITAEIGGRYGYDELRGLRRGDFVALSGQWLRGGVFGADRIERR